jgi:hypothetical protein
MLNRSHLNLVTIISQLVYYSYYTYCYAWLHHSYYAVTGMHIQLEMARDGYLSLAANDMAKPDADVVTKLAETCHDVPINDTCLGRLRSLTRLGKSTLLASRWHFGCWQYCCIQILQVFCIEHVLTCICWLCFKCFKELTTEMPPANTALFQAIVIASLSSFSCLSQDNTVESCPTLPNPWSDGPFTAAERCAVWATYAHWNLSNDPLAQLTSTAA